MCRHIWSLLQLSLVVFSIPARCGKIYDFEVAAFKDHECKEPSEGVENVKAPFSRETWEFDAKDRKDTDDLVKSIQFRGDDWKSKSFIVGFEIDPKNKNPSSIAIGNESYPLKDGENLEFINCEDEKDPGDWWFERDIHPKLLSEVPGIEGCWHNDQGLAKPLVNAKFQYFNRDYCGARADEDPAPSKPTPQSECGGTNCMKSN